MAAVQTVSNVSRREDDPAGARRNIRLVIELPTCAYRFFSTCYEYLFVYLCFFFFFIRTSVYALFYVSNVRANE
jgi:hypothetical protein